MMINGACHCGQIRFRMPKPTQATRCNCTICTKLGWVLSYYKVDEVEVTGAGRSAGYIQGDATLTSYHCPTCGCATHWIGRGEHADRIGVNLRLFEVNDIAEVTVRFLDGADTWQTLGETPFRNFSSCN
jgi:hypothetical protein